ncbi:MAG: hypothetical protein AB7P40_14120 [Chloroflexota bacterium]
MPSLRHPSHPVIWLLPLAFLVCSWFAAAGFPYFLDNNESFLSYVHARNLEIWTPGEYGWLTAEATDPLRPDTEDVYTHNPNGPRYLHYLLLKLGIRELPQHVLILGLLGTALTAWLLTRVFHQPGLWVVSLAVVLDYVGFLAWTVNTYRVWTFVLYFGLVLAVMRRRPVWVGVLSFLLFQVEYGMALFIGVTVAVLAFLVHGRRGWWLIGAARIGASVSLAVFAVQVLMYFGLSGLLDDLYTTYLRRGTDGEALGPLTFAYHSWHGLYELAVSIGRDTYTRPVLVITVTGLGLAILILRRPNSTSAERFLAALMLSTLIGTLAVSTVLYGYFIGGFVQSLLPLSVFLVAPATGLVALELKNVLARRWSSPYLGAVCGGLALVPMVWSSLIHYEPPVAVPLFQMLQTDLRRQPVVAPFLGPALAGPELAFSLTGGRAAATSDIDVTTSDLRRLADFKNVDGSLTYICLDTLYLRQRHKDGAFSVCELAASRMARRGDETVASGLGWSVMRVRGQEPATALTVTDPDTGREELP